MKKQKFDIIKLFSFAGDKKYLFCVMIVLVVFEIMFGIVAPKFIGYATDEIARAGYTKFQTGIFKIDYELILKYVLICLVLYITSMIVYWINSYITGKLYANMLYNLKIAVFEKIQKLPISYFEKRNRGEIISSFTTDFDKIDEFLYNTGSEFVGYFLTILGSVVIMFSINFVMTIVILILSPITIYLTKLILKKSKVYAKERQSVLASVNSIVEETLTAHDMISTYGLEEHIDKKLNEENKKLRIANIKGIFLTIIVYPITNIMANLSYIIIVFIAVLFAISGRISIGDIQSFIIYLRNFNGKISNISVSVNEIQSASIAMSRINKLLDEKEDINGSIQDDLFLNNSIKFKNVNFSYDKDSKVLDGISFEIKKGEKIALVGHTGGGKSTITKLLSRYYEINSGTIEIDGKDISLYDKKKIRDICSVVLQDAWLFSGSIMENIRYGKPDASDEEVINASKIAYSHDFIIKLKDGYNTVIDEEMDNISQGQKQLITIARAILKNSDIIILDEATGSVDTKIEKLLQASMDNLLVGRTSIIIAHRLSTIFNADRIFVIDKGKIIEQGNHKELIKNKGYYYDLYTKVNNLSI